MTATRRHSSSLAQTLAAAVRTAPDSHDYVLTDTADGRVMGIYATKALATAAVRRLAGTPGVFVLTVLHPASCGCPERA